MTTDNITEPVVEDASASLAWEGPPVETITEPETEATPETPTAPETPEVTIPFSVPDSLKTPEPETPGGLTPAEVETLQSENAALRRGQAETQRIQAQNQNATSVQELTQKYINTFQMDETTARFAATEVINERQQGEAKLAQSEVKGQIEVGRRNAAQHYGNQYKVDPSALIGLDSPEAMEREAKWIVAWNTNDKRVAAVERSKVPDQDFAGGGSGDSVTSDNIDALYIQYEAAHPNGNNPYEARYRTFLSKQN